MTPIEALQWLGVASAAAFALGPLILWIGHAIVDVQVRHARELAIPDTEEMALRRDFAQARQALRAAEKILVGWQDDIGSAEYAALREVHRALGVPYEILREQPPVDGPRG